MTKQDEVQTLIVYNTIRVDAAAALGYRKEIKAYLDRNLKEEDLVHGVSFASGGSGFDDFTANITVSHNLKHL
ncbi:hypothetical protein Hanom_Chr15g01360241 [Helianthus anomalus]